MLGFLSDTRPFCRKGAIQRLLSWRKRARGASPDKGQNLPKPRQKTTKEKPAAPYTMQQRAFNPWATGD
jgi:hypothetical protein